MNPYDDPKVPNVTVDSTVLQFLAEAALRRRDDLIQQSRETNKEEKLAIMIAVAAAEASLALAVERDEPNGC